MHCAGGSIAVPLQREGGTYVVAVRINNAISLNFVVDSGAADVSIPADVVSTLMRTGTLQESDFIGIQTYKLADGSTLPSRTFRIKSLMVGSTLVEGVTGSVAPAAGVPLLGQSFLTRFKSWSIDNAKSALVFEPQDGEAIIQTPPTVQIAPSMKRRFRITEKADDGYLALRGGPGVTYNLIAQMPVGTTGMMGNCVPLDGGYLPFCEVEWNGNRGWASSCCMADVDDTQATSTPKYQCWGEMSLLDRLQLQLAPNVYYERMRRLGCTK